MQFSGRICGSVVLAKPGDYLDAFEGCCEDNSIKGYYTQSDGATILFHGFIYVFLAITTLESDYKNY